MTIKAAPSNSTFEKAVTKANEANRGIPGRQQIKATQRQFRKWCRGYGSAFEAYHNK